MDFELDEVSRQVAATARDFAAQYIRPHVMEWDEVQHFPIEVMRAMGKLGLMGVVVPEEYGGAGMGYMEYVLVIEEIAKVCGSIGLKSGSPQLALHRSYPGFWKRRTKKRISAQTGFRRMAWLLGSYRGKYRQRCGQYAMHGSKRRR